MRTIEEIEKSLQGAQAAYESGVKTLPVEKVAKLSAAVVAAKHELRAALSEGANPCKTCGAPPMGMKQQHSIFGDYIEVNCASCRDPRPRASRPKGKTPAEAVAAWNAENPSAT